MSKSRMKEELSQRLHEAQLRWFTLKEQGESKHGLKMKGLREKGDIQYFLRPILFTGGTRVAYERELKRFIEFAHEARGRERNQDITRKDFRAYIEKLMRERKAASYINKVKSAIVKFGAIYKRPESFAAMSRKLGKRIRLLTRSQEISGPKRPRVTALVGEKAIDRLRNLDQRHEARTHSPRGYHLALRLQKEAALRAIEATERFTRDCLLGAKGDMAEIRIVGKGGRPRTLSVSADLHRELVQFFQASPERSLAAMGAYRSAYRRAILYVGGRSTGTHAQRRISAQEHKDTEYWKELKAGRNSKEASTMAKQAAVDRLGHSRLRQDIAKAYLR